LTVKENGKATVEVKHADLPIQLVMATSPLEASLVLASFGASEGLNAPVFQLDISVDPNAAPPAYDKPLRYGKRDEIHHIFRSDPQSPPKVISAFFVLAVLAGLPLLFAAWLILGANVSDLSTAMSAAPLAHAVFFGSLVAIEGIFYFYYVSWSLFATLPVLGAAGAAAFLSGTKALGEVQDRRLAGKR
jgi:oligosaccharyltransferase complex subunit delta (ribophorin II)